MLSGDVDGLLDCIRVQRLLGRCEALYSAVARGRVFGSRDNVKQAATRGSAETSVIVVYRGTVTDGVPRALSETLEVRTFADDEIPWEELAFPSTREALRDYLEAERGAALRLSRNLPGRSSG